MPVATSRSRVDGMAVGCFVVSQWSPMLVQSHSETIGWVSHPAGQQSVVKGLHWRGLASCHFRVGWVGRGVAGLVGLGVCDGRECSTRVNPKWEQCVLVRAGGWQCVLVRMGGSACLYAWVVVRTSMCRWVAVRTSTHGWQCVLVRMGGSAY